MTHEGNKLFGGPPSEPAKQLAEEIAADIFQMAGYKADLLHVIKDGEERGVLTKENVAACIQTKLQAMADRLTINEQRQNEIEAAFQLYVKVLTGQTNAALTAQVKQAINAQVDTLAWVLGMPQGQAFQNNLNFIRKATASPLILPANHVRR